MSEKNKSSIVRKFVTHPLVTLLFGVVFTLVGQGVYDYYVKAEETKESYNLLMLREDLKTEINKSVKQNVNEAFSNLEKNINSVLRKEVQKHVSQHHNE